MDAKRILIVFNAPPQGCKKLQEQSRSRKRQFHTLYTADSVDVERILIVFNALDEL